jgi:hypothetical protein
MKNLVVNVRILDADPGEGVEMKVSLFYIAKEGPPLIGAKLQLNANVF